MRVLFLASWFPSRVFPTHGNFVAKHARLVATEHELSVVAIQEDPDLGLGKYVIETNTQDGYELIMVYFGCDGTSGQAQKVWRRFRAWRKGLAAYRRQSERPAIIHAHVLLDAGMIAMLWAIRWRIPYVITEHSTAYWSPQPLPGLRGWLGRQACRRAAAVLPVTRALGKAMQVSNGLPGTYLPVSNVVNTDLFTLVPPPSPPPFIWLHVSNFRDWHKNISGLLRAFGKALSENEQPMVLHLAGDGDLEDLQSSIEKAQLPASAVRVSGPHSEKEIARLFHTSHAFVLFSQVENQPVVILEALSSGRPCVATSVGGLPELIHPSNGKLVPPNDEAKLTRALLAVREDYPSYNRENIRKNALSWCSPDTVLRQFTDVYRRALVHYYR